jgi:hypothetical protein
LTVAIAGLTVPSPAIGATEVKRYRAWDAAGDPIVSEFTERRGSCNSGSFVNPRSDAWRCFVGHRIYDPCFENPVYDREVLCVASPWARTGVVVRSRLDPADRYPFTGFRAWALRLENGRGCVFVSGASGVVKGRRLNYVCRLRRFGVAGPPFLFGDPDRRRATWTILKANNYEGRSWRRVRIRAAWR